MSSEVHQIDTCEVCGNADLVSVLDLGMHPMCDDLVSIGEDRTCREYPIEILFCKQCVTAHQRFQVPKHELFPSSYHYRSRFTADVLKGMKEFVGSCVRQMGSLDNKTVLDIGCNDGSLLDYFRAEGAKTLGVEPTDACEDAKEKNHVTFNDYLSEDLADTIVAKFGKPDLITFTNVFAHIENLHEVFRALKKLIKESTQIVIENHYLGAVFAKNQFDTFYHEHPRTYSYTSFVYMARSLGLGITDVEFPSRYGGNIRVFMGSGTRREDGIDRKELDSKESAFFNNFSILRDNIKRWKEVKSKVLKDHFKKSGKLHAKGFPGRAAILVKMLDLDENVISKVYEKPGSMKIGNYVPGTRIPIHSDDELLSLSDKSQSILNLAWHIPDEINNYLQSNGYPGPVIAVLCESDFL